MSTRSKNRSQDQIIADLQAQIDQAKRSQKQEKQLELLSKEDQSLLKLLNGEITKADKIYSLEGFSKAEYNAVSKSCNSAVQRLMGRYASEDQSEEDEKTL